MDPMYDDEQRSTCSMIFRPIAANQQTHVFYHRWFTTVKDELFHDLRYSVMMVQVRQRKRGVVVQDDLLMSSGMEQAHSLYGGDTMRRILLIRLETRHLIRIAPILILLILVWQGSQWNQHNKGSASTTQILSPPHANQARCPSLLAEASQGATSMIQKLSFDDSSAFETTNRKPYFILHIGPSKTGTTTLQKDSVRLHDELQKDGMVYLGRYAPRSLRQPAKIAELFANDKCLQQVAASIEKISPASTTFSNRDLDLPECWKDRTKGIRDSYHAHNISIIVSDELFSYERQMISICNDPKYLPTLKMALGQDWNLMVVATYRRYAEWLLSVTKEVNQKVCHNSQRPEGQWSGQRCWSLWQLVNTYRSTTTGDAFSYMNLDTTLPAWSRLGTIIPVRILDLYKTQPLTTSMYCNVIPNSPHTCDYLRKTNNNDHLNNTRENVQSVMTTAYNDIVYDAFVAGLLQPLPIGTNGTSPTRQEFVSALARQGTLMDLQMADLPLHCPRRSDLEALLQKSITMERVLLGTNLEREGQHQRDFWRLADDRKEFCSVDTQRLLHRKASWKQVLEHLQRLTGSRSFGMVD